MENQYQKIQGYIELTQDQINLINEIKATGTLLKNLIEKVTIDGQVDMRWASIAKTNLQQGLMALTRSVAKTENF